MELPSNLGWANRDLMPKVGPQGPQLNMLSVARVGHRRHKKRGCQRKATRTKVGWVTSAKICWGPCSPKGHW